MERNSQSKKVHICPCQALPTAYLLSHVEWSREWWSLTEEEQGHLTWLLLSAGAHKDMCDCTSFLKRSWKSHRCYFNSSGTLRIMPQASYLPERHKGRPTCSLTSALACGIHTEHPLQPGSFHFWATQSWLLPSFVSRLWLLGSVPINLRWDEVSATSFWKSKSLAFSIWFNCMKYLWVPGHFWAPLSHWFSVTLSVHLQENSSRQSGTGQRLQHQGAQLLPVLWVSTNA